MIGRRGLRSVLSIAVAALTILAAIIVLAILITARPPVGPLGQVRIDAISVDFPLPSGQVGTWGNVLPVNPTLEEIKIQEIELVGVSGLEIEGVSISDPDRDGGIGTAYGYPPPGISVKAPSGSVLPSAGADRPHVQLLVGVRLEGSSEGLIEAIRVWYEHDGQGYELTMPFSLKAFDPAP